jgi:hypothetical protein
MPPRKVHIKKCCFNKRYKSIYVNDITGGTGIQKGPILPVNVAGDYADII